MQVRRCGLGEFRLSARYASFSYCGNMNSTMKSVRESFDGIFTKGSFEEFLKVADVIHDSPQYMWVARITHQQYRELTSNYTKAPMEKL